MSEKSWLEEFYPEEPSAGWSKIKAIKHSLQKWKGLREVNLRRHRIRKAPVPIDYQSCSLCHKYLSPTRHPCSNCPLAIQGDKCRTNNSPWAQYFIEKSPEPMISALKKALATAKKEEKTRKPQKPLGRIIRSTVVLHCFKCNKPLTVKQSNDWRSKQRQSGPFCSVQCFRGATLSRRLRGQSRVYNVVIDETFGELLRQAARHLGGDGYVQLWYCPNLKSWKAMVCRGATTALVDRKDLEKTIVCYDQSPYGAIQKLRTQLILQIKSKENP